MFRGRTSTSGFFKIQKFPITVLPAVSNWFFSHFSPQHPPVTIAPRARPGKLLKDLKKIWLVVEPTHLNNMLVKMGSSSPNWGEHKKCLKPPPRNALMILFSNSFNRFGMSNTTKIGRKRNRVFPSTTKILVKKKQWNLHGVVSQFFCWGSGRKKIREGSTWIGTPNSSFCNDFSCWQES